MHVNPIHSPIPGLPPLHPAQGTNQLLHALQAAGKAPWLAGELAGVVDEVSPDEFVGAVLQNMLKEQGRVDQARKMLAAIGEELGRFEKTAFDNVQKATVNLMEFRAGAFPGWLNPSGYTDEQDLARVLALRKRVDDLTRACLQQLTPLQREEADRCLNLRANLPLLERAIASAEAQRAYEAAKIRWKPALQMHEAAANENLKKIWGACGAVLVCFFGLRFVLQVGVGDELEMLMVLALLGGLAVWALRKKNSGDYQPGFKELHHSEAKAAAAKLSAQEREWVATGFGAPVELERLERTRDQWTNLILRVMGE